jgi:hypothetical protein
VICDPIEVSGDRCRGGLSTHIPQGDLWRSCSLAFDFAIVTIWESTVSELKAAIRALRNLPMTLEGESPAPNYESGAFTVSSTVEAQSRTA